MTITAKEVNNLRKMTGAGMMDCKKALQESEGDVDKAIELLRKKGQKVSQARQDKEANEGAILAISNDDSSCCAMIELSCETDFVARNEDFQNTGLKILKAALENSPETIDDLQKINVDGITVQDHLMELISKIRENIKISNYAILKGDKVCYYIHPGARLGVLVSFNGVSDGLDIDRIGKDISMQIASMNPVALDKDSINKEIIDREIEIGKEQAKQEGKPDQLLEKIALGKLNKFYKENTLLEQDFVKDPSKTIKQYLKEQNPELSISAFKRMHVGE